MVPPIVLIVLPTGLPSCFYVLAQVAKKMHQIPAAQQLFFPHLLFHCEARCICIISSLDPNQESNQYPLFSTLHAGSAVMVLQVQTWHQDLACCLWRVNLKQNLFGFHHGSLVSRQQLADTNGVLVQIPPSNSCDAFSVHVSPVAALVIVFCLKCIILEDKLAFYFLFRKKLQLRLCC